MNLKPDLKIDWCSYEAAKYACLHWHYAKCVPGNKKMIKVGAWENGTYIGCVIFSRGANNNLGSLYGLEQNEVCELTRIALNQHVTPVSRILAFALKMLARECPGIRLVVSFADTEQGHHDGIYQATNWIYAGQSVPADEYIVKGKRYHGRSLRNFKPQNLTTREFAQRLDPDAQIIKGSPKHRYLMPLDAPMRDQIRSLSKSYPKRPNQAMAVTNGTAEGQHLPGRSIISGVAHV